MIKKPTAGSSYPAPLTARSSSFAGRRSFLIGLGSLAAVSLPGFSWAKEEYLAIDFYGVPTCNCCKGWVKYMEASGFSVNVNMLDSVAAMDQLKRDKSVPKNLEGCHTSIVGNYVIEGHVSADEIRTILRDKPKIIGLSVPGMPQGSPGMEGPNPESYDTFAIPMDGDPWVFRTHPIA